MSENQQGFTNKSEAPKTFFEDLIFSVLNPGYIGTSSIIVINVAFVLSFAAIIWRLLILGFEGLETYVHLSALIPLIGLWISFDW